MSKIEDVARRRRTLKLLPEPDSPLPDRRLSRETVESLLRIAGWAPFHRPHHRARDGLETVVEPWRFYMFDGAACRALIPKLDGFSTPPGKIANMLAAADALILATWIPEPSAGLRWDASDFNMEHVAAAGAAVQTLLLAATEAGIGSYWSSGGVLATPEAFELFGIAPTECLLGAVFLFPDAPEGVATAPGKLRAKRSGPEGWSRWIDLDAG